MVLPSALRGLMCGGWGPVFFGPFRLASSGEFPEECRVEA